MGMWSLAIGGTLMRAIRLSEGGCRDGKGKRLIAKGNCKPLGITLDVVSPAAQLRRRLKSYLRQQISYSPGPGIDCEV
jgi:hypothetical protein